MRCSVSWTAATRYERSRWPTRHPARVVRAARPAARAARPRPRARARGARLPARPDRRRQRRDHEGDPRPYDGALMADFGKAIAEAYATEGAVIDLGRGVHEGALAPEAVVRLPLATMNRHGLIAGAT